jgi:hypothetical protein
MSNEELMIASKTQPLKEALDCGIGTGEAPTDEEPDQQTKSRHHWGGYIQRPNAILSLTIPTCNSKVRRRQVQWILVREAKIIIRRRRRKEKKLSACRGEGGVVGLQLRVRFVPAALLAMLRTALALQCVSKARDWTGHVDR